MRSASNCCTPDSTTEEDNRELQETLRTLELVLTSVCWDWVQPKHFSVRGSRTKTYKTLRSTAHGCVRAHSHIHTEGVMNSACCLETSAEISMTKLPNELVTISFALILSSIINFLSQRRLRLYQPLAAGISAFHLTIIPWIKEQPRCANAQACVHAARCALAPHSQTHRVI